MAAYDVPHVTHDMILRFMNVNLSAIVDGSARIPSSIGTNTKPIFVATSTAKPMNLPASVKPPSRVKRCGKVSHKRSCIRHLLTSIQSAYYNAGSAALILVLVLVGIGAFLWYRACRNHRMQLPQNKGAEESMPLTNHPYGHPDEDDEQDLYPTKQNAKGKARAVENGYSEGEGEPMFNVSDSDDEDTGHRWSWLVFILYSKIRNLSWM